MLISTVGWDLHVHSCKRVDYSLKFGEELLLHMEEFKYFGVLLTRERENGVRDCGDKRAELEGKTLDGMKVFAEKEKKLGKNKLMKCNIKSLI